MYKKFFSKKGFFLENKVQGKQALPLIFKLFFFICVL